jgi:hypothetical protein
MTHLKKQLPRGIDSFPDIIRNGYLYVDKTEDIYNLLLTERYCFFTRPRRFGKSLLISTMDAIFRGEKELFTNLWIGKQSNYTWPKHAVIRLDMARVLSSTKKELEDSICRLLDAVASEYSVYLGPELGPVEKICYLIDKLTLSHTHIAVLVDEYDYAIINNLTDEALIESHNKTLHDFYIGLKVVSRHINFLFFTGVSRFAQTSLFSALNNLTDLSLLPKTATLAGYTNAEIEEFFMPHITDMAQARSMSIESIFEEMRTWYNGYRFSKAPITVYNPHSILMYLENQECLNYWFRTGTPSFLLKKIKDENCSIDSLNHTSISYDGLTIYATKGIYLNTLLYQTGYLTIEAYNEMTKRFILQYPNKEVELSLSTHLLGIFLKQDAEKITHDIDQMRESLFAENIKGFSAILTSLLTNIPYQLHIEREAYYHSILHTIGMLLGFDVQSEVSMSTGRIDMVITLPTAIYVMEFKLNDSPERALTQIISHGYADIYAQSNKKIILVGLNFNYTDKTLSIEWVQQ